MATSTTGTINAQSIGTVKGLTGTATATDTQGVTRTLQIGDVVFANEIIQTTAGSTVHLEFINGGYATVASESTLALDNTVFSPEGQEATDAEIAQAQARIAAGEDPAAVVDPAAAGPEAGGDAQEGSTFVFVEQDAAAGALTPGFDTTTFTQEIVQPEEEANYLVEDDEPTAGESVAAVDDDGLPDGNPESIIGDLDTNAGEVPYTASEAIYNGTLAFDFGDDGPGGIGFEAMSGTTGTIGTETVTYDWNDSTDTLTATITGGDRDGDPLFDVTVDPLTGEFTVTLQNNVLHAGGPDYEGETDPTATLIYTVSDSDDDTANGTLTITFDDDAPSITAVEQSERAPSAELDETDGFDTATISSGIIAGMFDSDYGADGEGSISYALDATDGAATGLWLAGQTGAANEIELIKVSDTTYEGREGGAGGTLAFTVSIDGTSGEVTVTQHAALEHLVDGPTPTDHNDPLYLTGDAAIGVTQSIVDADGDTDSATSPYALQITFFDDGPNAQLADVAADTLVLDESDLPDPAETPVVDDGIDDGIRSVTANFADNFETTIDYGTDGAGSVAYALSLSDTSVGSGLYALGTGGAQGAEIMLSQVGNTITGSVGATDYFTITVNTTNGEVTFTQINNIWHPTAGSTPATDHDDAQTLTLGSGEYLNIVQTVTDADGDTDSASINLGSGVFTIEDDGPNAQLADVAADTLVLDESDLPDPAETPVVDDGINDGIRSVTANFADNFETTIDYGTDGAGSVAYALSLSDTSVGSGLYALGTGGAQGAEIMLSQVGNTITGSVGATDYFTITVNTTNGEVTFTQINNIWHPTAGSTPATDHDDAQTLTLGSGEYLNIVQTVTDADGDTDSASINLGSGVFTIEDDGPNAQLADVAADTLVLDESDLPDPAETPVVDDGIDDGIRSVTANFADNFETTIDYGTDGAGSVAYALSLSDTSVGSGLYALGTGGAQGAEIMLSQVGNTITGSVGATDYFTITVNTTNGEVTFTQINNIWHPTAGSTPATDHDDAQTLTLGSGEYLNIVQTVTDADGDTDSASINLGSGVFTIEDDGPNAQLADVAADTLVLDESDLPDPAETPVVDDGIDDGIRSVTANFADNFETTIDYGTDGAGSVAYALSLSDTSVGSGLYALGTGGAQGAEIMLSQVGNTITGSVGATDYFTITVNTTNGEVTFTQINNIWHPTAGSTPATDHDDAQTLTLGSGEYLNIVQTVTDADGDTDSASINLGSGVFTIEDDGPNAQLADVAADTLVLDESDLPDPAETPVVDDGIDDGIRSVTANFADNFETTIDYGTDGAGSVAYALSLSDTSVGSGLYALGTGGAQGAEIMLSQVGNTITGSVGATDYFTITVNTTNGEVTFTQINNIWHPTAGSTPATDHDDAQTLTLGSGEYLNIVQTVTDADGDTDSASINLGSGVFTIEDDGPNAQLADVAADTLVLDESDLPDPAETPVVDDGINDGIRSVTANFADNFETTIDYGTDGAGSVAYALSLSDTSVGSGLYALGTGGAQGAEIMLSQVGNTITGSVGATDYFTITVNTTNGEVTFTQINNIWHPTAGSTPATDHDDAQTLTLGSGEYLNIVQTVTDADGDTDSASINLGSGVFTIEDDGPNAQLADVAADTLVLDESDLPDPAETPVVDDGINDGIRSVTANFADNFETTIDYGTDGAGSVAYALSLSDTSVGSGLYALGTGGAQGAEIMLSQVGNTITGSVGATDYFTITVNTTNGEVTFTQINNIWHPTAGSTPATDHDDAQTLTLGSGEYLNIVQTVTDADGDTDSASINLGSGVFTIEDDGPNAQLADVAADTLVLDESDLPDPAETPVVDDGIDDGIRSVTANFADNFETTIDYGTDGAGSVAYALSLSDTSVGSGLYALGTGGAQGAEIMLSQVGNTITGSVGATDYFTITVNTTNGEVTFTQINNIWHPTAGSTPATDHDDAQTLTLGSGEYLNIVQTVTDADGDTDSASINLGSGVFTIEDDGPNAQLADVAADTLVLDESDLPDPAETPVVDDGIDDGIRSVTANFADNFETTIDYGTDGAGSVAYALSLSDTSVGSGLYALGTGGAQGAEIMLSQVGNTITGSVGATDYFTITVNTTNGEVTFTQINNIWHPTAGSTPATDHDDAQTLTLGSGEYLNIVQTVTDADGDTDSASINLGSGVFTIEDDGPNAQLADVAADTLVLDESDLPDPAETPVVDDGIDDGIRSVTANFADNFETTIDYGTDGAGSVAYALSLSDTSVGSGLYALGTGGAQGAEIMLSQVGNTITGSVGATDYFTITVNTTNGEVTFTQINNIWHPTAGSTPATDHDDAQTLTLGSGEYLNIVQTVTDADGDTDSASINLGSGVFTIEDDGPNAQLADVAADTLVLDESDLPDPAETPVVDDGINDGIRSVTANFADNFETTIDYGTDGAGSVAYALSLSDTSVGSGLYALGTGGAQGAEIMLSQVGNTITGSVGATDYFTITVNTTNGEVTFTQINNIWHPTAGSTPATDHDDAQTLTLGSGEYLNIVQTVTDADGDTDSASINLGSGVFTIEDDGPNAQLADVAADTLVLDESDLPDPAETPVVDDGIDDGIRSVTANFADNFETTIDYGTDGAGSVAYALSLSDTSVGSGLYALGTGGAQGAEIMLSQVGNTITGSVGATDYFTITVNTTNGEVTFTQINNIWHPTAGSTPATDHDDAQTLTLGSGEYLNIVQTVTDADGDTDSASINLGSGVFTIEDDGPNAQLADVAADTLVLDESDLPDPAETPVVDDGIDDGIRSVTANFADNFETTIDYGTDGAGSVAYALSLSDTSVGSGLYALGTGGAQGAEIMLSQVGNTITGSVGATDYFTITVNTTNGEVTFTQINNIWHPTAGSTPATDHDDAQTLTLGSGEYLNIVQTVTDADGDTDSASINLGSGVFTIEDDGPNAQLADVAADTLVLDESDLPDPAETPVVDDGIDDGIRSVTANFADNFETTIDYGTDGAGSVAYALSLSDTSVGSGLYALGTGGAQGAEIMLSQVGNTITGSVGATDYFTITVNTTNGEVTFTQINNIWHPTAGSTPATDHDDAQTLTLGSGEYLNIVQTVTDADGDTDSASINLGSGVFTIEDDGPNAQLAGDFTLGTLTVDETEGVQAPEDSDRVDSLALAGAFTPSTDYGTDGAGSVSYDLELDGTSVASGLYALEAGDTSVTDGDGFGQGAEIMLSIDTNGDVIGTAGGNTYFTISVDGTGTVTLTQSASYNLWHADDTDHNDTESLSLAAETLLLTQTVTDADGDTDSASLDLSGGTFNFNDDGPSLFGPESIHILDDATTPDVTRALNFSGHTGTDGTGNVIFFQITDGEPAFDTNGLPLSFNGEYLHLYYGIDQTVLIASTVAPGSGGTVDINDTSTTAFWIDIDPTANTYTMHSNGIIENGSSLEATESDVISAGHVPFVVMTSLEDTDGQDVILTAANDINTSQVIGTGNNWFAVGEGIRFDLVNGAQFHENGGGTSDDSYSYATHNLTTSFKQDFVDVKSGGANITVTAMVADDDNDMYPTSGDGDDVAGIVQLYADNIRVWNGSTLMEQGVDYTVSDNGDKTFTVIGILAGWEVEIIATTQHPIEFNAIQMDAASGSADYRMGYFSYGTDYAGDPVPLQYTIVGMDGDGDAISSVINATLYPNDGMTWVGGTADDVYTDSDDAHYLLGDGGNDTLYGMGGDDILVGDVGTDLLYGGDGNDTLIGGPGNDTLDGGAGIDTASYSDTVLGVTVNLSTGSAAGEEIGVDTLTSIENVVGGAGDDILTGDAGTNVLVGGAGNDILVGGQGDDVLTGDAGADTFRWESGDEVGSITGDIITDFSVTEGDVLDLADLLQGTVVSDDTDPGYNLDGTSGGYLTFTSDGIDTTLHIDVDGSGIGTTSQQILIQGVDLTAGHADNSAIIQHLLDGGNLIVDDI